MCPWWTYEFIGEQKESSFILSFLRPYLFKKYLCLLSARLSRVKKTSEKIKENKVSLSHSEPIVQSLYYSRYQSTWPRMYDNYFIKNIVTFFSFYFICQLFILHLLWFHSHSNYIFIFVLNFKLVNYFCFLNSALQIVYASGTTTLRSTSVH